MAEATGHKPLHYRADIDGLRALAVLGVVAYHAFPRWLPGGFMGVDVFFVLSGYLITGIILKDLRHGRFTYREFYARRIRRLFPALATVLIFCLSFGAWLLYSAEYAHLAKHSIAGVLFYANLLSLKEAGYFDIASETKPLLHLWSLGVEEQFYLLWPPLLLWLHKKNVSLGKALTLLTLASLALGITLSYLRPSAGFYFPFARFWELAAGALLASGRFEIKNITHKQSELAGIAGLLLLITSLFLPAREWAFPGFIAILPVLATCLLLSSQYSFINAKSLSYTPLVWVGLISYPLYLWHWPLLSFATIIESGTPSVFWRVVIVGVSIALSAWTYLIIEKPLRHHRNPRLPLFLVVLMLGIVAAALVIRLEKGLPQRLAQQETSQQDFLWEKWQNTNEACRQRVFEMNPKLERKDLNYCLLADTKTAPTMALIGDSHSNQLYWGLAKGLNERGENLLQIGGGGGCIGVYSNEPITGVCMELMAEILPMVENTPSIHTLILTSRALYIRDMNAYERQLRVSLKRYVAAGKKVILVLDTPELGFNPKACLHSRPFTLSEKQEKKACEVSKKEVDASRAAYVAATKRAAEGIEQVEIIDAAPAFCVSQTCLGQENGHILYRDDHHLSLYGAEKLGKYILEQKP